MLAPDSLEQPLALADLAGEDHAFASIPVNNDLLLSATLLAEVATACRDLRAADALYRLLLPYAALHVDTLELSTGSVSRYLGLLAMVRRRPDDPEGHFEQAIEMNARMGAEPWLARTQCDLAGLLLSRGRPRDRERAGSLLAQARASAGQLGLAALDERLRARATAAQAPPPNAQMLR